MIKYRSLEVLLQQLTSPLDAGQVAIAGAWRNDEQALGLVKPDAPGLAAYVFTHGQSPGRYGVHLDYPATEALPGTVFLANEDLGLNALFDLLVTHFDLHEINT